MLIVKDIVSAIEFLAPQGLQETWDNSGLLTGKPDQTVSGVLVCLDVTPEVLDEAVSKGCNMVVSHHPAVFGAMKRFGGDSLQERVLTKAIRNDIVLYSCHTNLDSVRGGVSGKMAEILGLTGGRILVPRESDLIKLVCFIPASHAGAVGQAIFEAGAGTIGNYDSCSFQTDGFGTFRALEGSNPFSGQVGSMHQEPEVRFETIFPRHLQKRVVAAMLAVHPYDEVAYDLYPLLNKNPSQGLGVVADLSQPVQDEVFLRQVMHAFNLPVVRHTRLPGILISKVALCGGSGAEFLRDAIGSGADIYLTADIKYHSWFDIPANFILADIGHFESEQFAINVLAESIKEKFPKFAVCLTEVNTNPINYLI